MSVIMSRKEYNIWHRDTQHIDTHHNDTQHKDTQHNDTKHKDTQHNGTRMNVFCVTRSMMMLSVILLSSC
jgi:hypothetical protein